MVDILSESCKSWLKIKPPGLREVKVNQPDLEDPVKGEFEIEDTRLTRANVHFHHSLQTIFFLKNNKLFWRWVRTGGCYAG